MNASLPPTTVRREIIGIDIIRFLCAFSVVLAHFLPPLSENYAWAKYGGAGVDIFFVISGFIIPQSSEGRTPFAFIQSRVVRLVPGVWICATITLVFLLLAGESLLSVWGKYIRSMSFVPIMPGDVANLGAIWIDGVYWTLFVEIAFYGLILLLLLFNAFRYISVVATALGTISLVYWVALFGSRLLFPDEHFTQVLFDTGFKRYLDLSLVHHGAWFGLGINIWLLTKTRLRKRLLSILVCLAGGMLQEAHHAMFSLIDASVVPALLYDVVGVSLILLAIFSPLAQGYSENVRRICRWVGLTTYPLYLVHDRAGHIALAALAGSLLPSREAATWVIIPAAILLAFVIARFLEPPLQKSFKGVFEAIKPVLQSHNEQHVLLKKTGAFVGSS